MAPWAGLLQLLNGVSANPFQAVVGRTMDKDLWRIKKREEIVVIQSTE